jgi:hypothetical protein
MPPDLKRDIQAFDTPVAFDMSLSRNDFGAASSRTRVRSNSDVGLSDTASPWIDGDHTRSDFVYNMQFSACILFRTSALMLRRSAGV